MFQKSGEEDLVKCKRIKNCMLPITLRVTKELYYRCRTNITYDEVLNIVNQISNQKNKNLIDENSKIAKNIVDFLNNNGIIETDEGYEDKYYFTIFGNTYMSYFICGMI